jgi:hypothetical protein
MSDKNFFVELMEKRSKTVKEFNDKKSDFERELNDLFNHEAVMAWIARQN